MNEPKEPWESSGEERPGDSGSEDRHEPDEPGQDAATPAAERLRSEDRVPDTVWDQIVSDFRADRGFVPEMSRDEITDALEESEGYVPPDPGPIGVHTAPPILVLCWVLAIGGALGLLTMAVFFRGAPGGIVMTAVAATILGVLGLFWQLPKGRGDLDGDGSAV
ncbi:hypothetical protein [Sediminivirga luteola]|uniref:Uncharacterized protein n=1 Tax=Sediminivirga luteola TaxID=1774748 RepID=A0A8J2U014_9MICO|nr:hypothetical protein [Sediminivirga luteola]MCI2264032.1 hypothetical protein [Sediminivirga luteola]GGA22903.1 hypothetical protein GCM10011333_27370 [Sediminivirga luteola]